MPLLNAAIDCIFRGAVNPLIPTVAIWVQQ